MYSLILGVCLFGAEVPADPVPRPPIITSFTGEYIGQGRWYITGTVSPHGMEGREIWLEQTYVPMQHFIDDNLRFEAIAYRFWDDDFIGAWTIDAYGQSSEIVYFYYPH